MVSWKLWTVKGIYEKKIAKRILLINDEYKFTFSVLSLL